MAKNANLTSAAKAKNDEFYTLYDDIQRELNCYLDYDENVFAGKTILLPCDDPEWSNFTKFFAANFERYKIKKLISTSYAANSKKLKNPQQISLFESESPQFDEKITNSRGKIFTMTSPSDGTILKAMEIFAAMKLKNFLLKQMLLLQIRRSVCFANF